MSRSVMTKNTLALWCKISENGKKTLVTFTMRQALLCHSAAADDDYACCSVVAVSYGGVLILNSLQNFLYLGLIINV